MKKRFKNLFLAERKTIMKVIKVIAKLISYLCTYSLAYVVLVSAGLAPLPAILGLTVEDVPMILSIILAVDGVASFIADGLKKTILKLLIEGAVSGIAYGMTFLSGWEYNKLLIIICWIIIFVSIPIIIHKIKKGKITITWW